MLYDDGKEKNPYHELGFAILTAGLIVIVSELAKWGVDELRDRFGSTPPKPHDEPKKP